MRERERARCAVCGAREVDWGGRGGPCAVCMGRKGGATTRDRYGAAHFAALGRKGCGRRLALIARGKELEAADASADRSDPPAGPRP